MTENQKLLNELLAYDAETGSLTWKVRSELHFKRKKWQEVFNSKYAGEPAGTLDKWGYLAVRVKGKNYTAHRLIWEMVYGDCPRIIDHIDTNKLNNRLSNLRRCTTFENARNKGKTKYNTSGFKGVSLHKRSGRWRADIGVDGKIISLGLFDTKEAASAAYCEAADKYHGEFANHERKEYA